MRFSLTTLMLVAFWIGAMILVWVWRERYSFVSYHEVRPKSDWLSPDGTREAIRGADRRSISVYEYDGSGFRPNEALCSFIAKDRRYVEQVSFVDNDTLSVLHTGEPNRYQLHATYERRFPEWWWGHFYRPEVWLALALTGVLVWRGVCARRQYAIPGRSNGPGFLSPDQRSG